MAERDMLCSSQADEQPLGEGNHSQQFPVLVIEFDRTPTRAPNGIAPVAMELVADEAAVLDKQGFAHVDWRRHPQVGERRCHKIVDEN